MNIYCTFVSYVFFLLFLFLQAPLFFSTRQFVMLCLPVRFLSRTVQTGCVFTLRVFPDDAMETRRTGGDARARISWQLNRRLLTSLTNHKRANVECVCACTCACACVCVWLCERKSEKKKRPHKQRGKKWPESQTIWTGLSQLAVKADFREFRACSPTCFAPRAATATCPRKCPLSLLNLSVSGHEKAARSAARLWHKHKYKLKLFVWHTPTHPHKQMRGRESSPSVSTHCLALKWME